MTCKQAATQLSACCFSPLTPLHLSINLRFHRVPSVSHFQPARATSSAVVLYLHGGGFFADFQASHLHFLSSNGAVSWVCP